LGAAELARTPVPRPRGFSLSGLFGGGGVAWPVADAPCNRRSNALVIASLGYKQEALALFCNDAEARIALGPRICR